MKFNIYKDIKLFYKDTYESLIKDETQNPIMLSNIKMGNEELNKIDWRNPINWLMATISTNNKIVLIALMTPPFKLLLFCENNNELLDFFIEKLIENNIEIPGINAINELAIIFSKKYTKLTNKSFIINNDLRLHELTKVNNVPNIGTIRQANINDLYFLPYWFSDMEKSFGYKKEPISNYIERITYQISTNKIFLLEDNNIPVSMVKIDRELITTCSINAVYTPPFFRSKGYATSLVSKASQIILDRGFKKAILYTDLANPISNSIYKKIGYIPVLDQKEIEFL